VATLTIYYAAAPKYNSNVLFNDLAKPQIQLCTIIAGARRHSSNTTTTLTVMLGNMSAARLSLQPPLQQQQQQQQQMETECRRVETVPTTLELLPQVSNGTATHEDACDGGSSPRRPDVVQFTIIVDSA